MPEERIAAAIDSIKQELEERLEELKNHGKLLEAQRLNARTRFDIEMMLEVGFCPGIENYSRPLSGRPPGSTPHTLFNFYPDDYLLFVDESHATVPQVRGMFAGDHSRKSTLVEHGFRLPSALDNRPLKFDEWEQKINQVILRLGHARAVRAGTDRRRIRRAGHSPHGAARPGDRGEPRRGRRCRTCWSKFASERPSANACW